MRCFYSHTIGEIGDHAELDSRDVKHLFRTLRAKAGDEIELTDGRGRSAIAVIEPDDEIIIKSVEVANQPRVKLHLFVAPPKKGAMDQMLKQCAEVGVWSIQPMFTSRSVSTPEKSKTFERWQILLTEGCKQSKNPFVPQIHKPISFKEAIALSQGRGDCCYFGATDQETISAGKNKGDDSIDIAWFVGPEGGFTEEEQQIMVDVHFNKLAIGRCIMRVETAAITGASLLQYLFDQ